MDGKARKLELRKLLGCEAEKHIPKSLRDLTKNIDNRITAREIIQMHIHNNEYQTIPTPEWTDQHAPETINVFSDGSVKNPHVAYWRTGGIGALWPERSWFSHLPCRRSVQCRFTERQQSHVKGTCA